MTNLEGLKRQLQSSSDLRGVVSTMKTLSAVNVRQYDKAVYSLDGYAQTVALGLQVILRDHHEELITSMARSERVVAVIFGSDMGLCGRFNESIVSFALQHLEAEYKATTPSLIAVGARIALELEVRGHTADRVLHLPSSLASLTTVAQNILFTLESWGRSHQVQTMVLYLNSPQGQGRMVPRQRQIYPLDVAWLQRLAKRPWQSRGLPVFTMPWQDLFAALIREYYFVSLYRTLAQSQSSESAARLSAMQAAEDNIDERIVSLKRDLDQQRQSAITEELLDIIAGAEVLRSLPGGGD